MSQFKATLEIWRPGSPRRAAIVRLLVDTGATITWVPRSVLERIGVRPAERRAFETIEGRIIEREVAGVMARIDGRTSGIAVVFAEKGDGAVLGAQALEGLGLTADVVRRRLIPSISLAMSTNS